MVPFFFLPISTGGYALWMSSTCALLTSLLGWVGMVQHVKSGKVDVVPSHEFKRSRLSCLINHPGSDLQNCAGILKRTLVFVIFFTIVMGIGVEACGLLVCVAKGNSAYDVWQGTSCKISFLGHMVLVHLQGIIFQVMSTFGKCLHFPLVLYPVVVKKMNLVNLPFQVIISYFSWHAYRNKEGFSEEFLAEAEASLNR